MIHVWLIYVKVVQQFHIVSAELLNHSLKNSQMMVDMSEKFTENHLTSCSGIMHPLSHSPFASKLIKHMYGVLSAPLWL